MTARAIPPGFEVFENYNGFIQYVGPLYWRRDDAGEVFGMYIEARHCNTLDIAHGGLLATIADVVITRSVVAAEGVPPHAVTVNLNVDYIGGAKLGSWLEGRASVGKSGGSVAFASCELTVGTALVVRASGVMKYIKPR